MLDQVAVKIMDKRQLGEDLPRIRLEIAAMKVLCHQNICKLLQVLENDTKIYMVSVVSSSQFSDHIPVTTSGAGVLPGRRVVRLHRGPGQALRGREQEVLQADRGRGHLHPRGRLRPQRPQAGEHPDRRGPSTEADRLRALRQAGRR